MGTPYYLSPEPGLGMDPFPFFGKPRGFASGYMLLCVVVLSFFFFMLVACYDSQFIADEMNGQRSRIRDESKETVEKQLFVCLGRNINPSMGLVYFPTFTIKIKGSWRKHTSPMDALGCYGRICSNTGEHPS